MVPGCIRPLLVFSLPVLLFFLQGCARPMLRAMPAGVQESRQAEAAFERYLSVDRSGCRNRFDAEVEAEIFVKGWFSDRKGKLSGYLQAMEPGYLKFTAINPFGQPLLILLTNGREFKLLNVLDSAAYSGPVGSETFKKFAPAGFEPQQSYYWLTGRLPSGDLRISKVLLDREEKGFWLLIKDGPENLDRMVLLDPDRLKIVRHVLLNERGEPVVDVAYDNYLPENPAAGDAAGQGACLVPSTISIAADSGFEKKIDLALAAFLPDPVLSPADFDMEIPDNLELHVVR